MNVMPPPAQPAAAGAIRSACLRAREYLVGLSGWRRAVAAIILGITATAAFPPVYATPLIFIAFTGLLWLIASSRSVRSAAWIGWCFGLGHFTSGIYWVAVALLTDPERYGWMVPFAPTGLAAYLAFYAAIAAALTKLAERIPRFGQGPGRVVAFAAAWTIGEWLRGHLLTGFPWNLDASVWNPFLPLMQTGAWVGAYGFGFLTIVIVAMPAVLGELEIPERRAWRAVGAAALLFVAMWGVGETRLAISDTAFVPDTLLRVVQPDIAQDEKWRDELRVAHLRLDIDLTKEAAAKRPAKPGEKVFVIWPETAVPFLIEQEPEVRAAVASVVPQGGLVVTGAPRATPPDVTPFQVWNSVVAVDGAGEIVAHYDKFHLVPFGEYLPARAYLPTALGLSKLTPGTIDFSAGPGPQTLSLPGLPQAGPLICYEIIFPGDVANRDKPPKLFINVTNDAWFGTSSGPYQHFESARMRAIEEGAPVARAANTGISGVIDPYGRVIARLALNDQGSVDSPLPDALASPTLYSRVGDWIVLLLFAGASAIVWCIPHRR
jgi:apolipoprotein N-acyltransferase